MNMKMRQATREAEERKGFFSREIFEKIKKYLHSAKKDDPPVIGTTENFCEPDPPVVGRRLGMTYAKDVPAKKDLSMEAALSDAAPGHADLVNKLTEEEADE